MPHTLLNISDISQILHLNGIPGRRIHAYDFSRMPVVRYIILCTFLDVRSFQITKGASLNNMETHAFLGITIFKDAKNNLIVYIWYENV